jgi:glutathione S-transferase
VIFHLALAGEWDGAVARGGPYERSTIGRSLADVGFIHCSFEHQVAATAERFYAGRDDVVLLCIDEQQLDHELRCEDLVGGGEAFPHLYGPLSLDAVVEVRSWPPAAQPPEGSRRSRQGPSGGA